MCLCVWNKTPLSEHDFNNLWAFLSGKMPRTVEHGGPYPFELRLRVVRMYLEEEYPVSMICRETGVGRSTIFLSLNSVKCYPIYLAKLLIISRVARFVH